MGVRPLQLPSLRHTIPAALSALMLGSAGSMIAGAVGPDRPHDPAAPAGAGEPAFVPARPLVCAAASRSEPVAVDGPLLSVPPTSRTEASADRPRIPEVAGSGGDYRDRLASTAHGWARLERWCVWIEPASGSAAAQLWEQRWRSALGRALQSWQAVLPIQVVDDPTAAQVRIWRRRPPLGVDAWGRRRASHGRATLSLRRVQREGSIRLEPSVEVELSPAQRELAIEATALHELGHAFGLWGHSDDGGDAMAAIPGASPVLELSRRDLATLRWLYSQPTALGQPAAP